MKWISMWKYTFNVNLNWKMYALSWWDTKIKAALMLHFIYTKLCQKYFWDYRWMWNRAEIKVSMHHYTELLSWHSSAFTRVYRQTMTCQRTVYLVCYTQWCHFGMDNYSEVIVINNSLFIWAMVIAFEISCYEQIIFIVSGHHFSGDLVIF